MEYSFGSYDPRLLEKTRLINLIINSGYTQTMDITDTPLEFLSIDQLAGILNRQQQLRREEEQREEEIRNRIGTLLVEEITNFTNIIGRNMNYIRDNFSQDRFQEFVTMARSSQAYMIGGDYDIARLIGFRDYFRQISNEIGLATMFN
jgi:hypothetical protein